MLISLHEMGLKYWNKGVYKLSVKSVSKWWERVGTSEFVNICKKSYCFLKIKSLKKIN